MEFKLVRIDTSEPQKIDLPEGTHIIGRGKFIVNDAEDMRVSRNHAEIEVTDTCVILKSLHQNPCFYIDKLSNSKRTLTQNNAQLLCNGDKFGILPDTYWFELIWCSSDVMKNDVTSNSTPADNKEIPNELRATQEYNLNETNGLQETVEEGEAPQTLKEQSLEKQSESPQKSSQDEIVGKRSITSEDCNNSSESKRLKIKNEEESGDEARGHEDSSVAGPSCDQHVSILQKKRRKEEQNDNGEVKDQNTSQNSNHDGAQGIKSPRERCMYGANCYRRNPQHAALYSHPRDADWTPAPRCRYGERCTRRDPRHRRDYLHPAPAPAPADPPGMQLVQRHGNTFYINAHTVNFYDDHFQVEDSDGDSVDYDYEF
ncbi:aprataxin and PNK-like factor isoform X4 [Bombyx mori]|uniref:PBZ-type domain-containing protein n=1 Tax=Bombyx mori TaxID=7091 RepID=A0A8R2C6G5_BOMMO|nr:aprataxin and PNK-like factor isoform X4 [Bombyx mori]XP_021204479.1 aprataxin and PNK-like factor isoform X4 [Bombyx mori]